MTFTSQKFIDTRTGEIVILVPVMDIGHFEKYHGSAEVGEFGVTDSDLEYCKMGVEWKCPKCGLLYDEEPEGGCSYPKCGQHT